MATKGRKKSAKEPETESCLLEASQEKPPEKGKQTKIDELLPQMNKEPNIQDLLDMMKQFDKKMSKLASKEYIENSLLKLVTEDFVKDRLEALKADITKEIKVEIDKINDKISRVNSKLLEFSNDIETLKNESSDLKSELDKQIEKNEKLAKSYADLEEKMSERVSLQKFHESRLNTLEQYTRNNSVRIYGLKDVDKSESADDSRDLVIKTLNDKLHMKISPQEIDIAHRLGRFQTDGDRPVICKFLSKATKKKIIGLRRQLKGTSIVIREDLTIKNAKLLEEVSGKKEVRNAWSDEGKIIAVLLNGKKLRFDLLSDLSKPLIPAQELKLLLEAENSEKDK
jgi:hypothetical protein